MSDTLFIVVAEKPSVARSIKNILTKANILVTSVRGHLMEADLPDGYEWGMKHPLEIIKLRNVVDRISDKKTFKKLVKLFNRGGVLVIATDNDSEGELIGSEILKVFRSVRGEGAEYLRMRFNSLDRSELLASWGKLEKDLNWRWVEKARFRQVFDLITGAAFTRLLTQSTQKRAKVRLISWGSCQTPTLNFVVEREKEILSFKPKKYWTITAVLETEDGQSFTAKSDVFLEEQTARTIFETVKNVEKAVVYDYSSVEKLVPRPLPMRTDDVLRDLTRITGLYANKLLSIMEDLYAEGFISYPRTDTNRYGKSFYFDHVRRVVEESGIFSKVSDVKEPRPRNGGRDDGAHPPIYPTAVYRGKGIRMRVWEYIARRFYANAYAEDAVQRLQQATVSLGQVTLSASGSSIVSEGFYTYFHYFRPDDSPLPTLYKGQTLQVLKVELIEDETKPPTRLTEADLLRLMEKHGIGTDATRAIYPQLIIERNYARRKGRYFTPTVLGMKLIEALAITDRRLVTPETRRMVEEYMMKIERSEATLEESLDKSLQLYEVLLKSCSERIEEISSLLAAAIRASEPNGRKNAKRPLVRQTYK